MFRLIARRGKPNRQLPIGGKIVHVRTGSSRLIEDELVPALRAELDARGCAADYQLIRIAVPVRKPVVERFVKVPGTGGVLEVASTAELGEPKPAKKPKARKAPKKGE